MQLCGLLTLYEFCGLLILYHKLTLYEFCGLLTLYHKLTVNEFCGLLTLYHKWIEGKFVETKKRLLGRGQDPKNSIKPEHKQARLNMHIITGNANRYFFIKGGVRIAN